MPLPNPLSERLLPDSIIAKQGENMMNVAHSALAIFL